MTRHSIWMSLGYVAIAGAMVSLGFAVYYGNAADRNSDPRRFSGNRWLSFFFPSRGPDGYIGIGWRYRMRQLVTLLLAVGALFVAGFLASI